MDADQVIRDVDAFEEMQKHKSCWIQTFTGQAFNILDPNPGSIDIKDIAHALSLKCRFAGHCIGHYSVAQHSFLVSHHCKPKHALWGLLHDAPETYLPDVPTPIKSLLEGFEVIETNIQVAVALRFNLTWAQPHGFPAEVNSIDKRILIDEVRQVMPPADYPWGLRGEPLLVNIATWQPAEAEAKFINRFNELMPDRNCHR